MEDWAASAENTLMNPQPVIVEEPDALIGDFLSPFKLQEISGQDNLNDVESIEMVVNTTETTLGNFGQYLPSLSQLKLNDSCIPTVRDIGTAFSHLTVLWMSRCKLNDVDGIASMSLLQELYISYNNIEDLSPISFLDCLEVLDLEGNAVSDVDQLDYLSIMNNLTTLTLTGNPICQSVSTLFNQSFKAYLLTKLPNLKILNDVDTSASDSEEANSSCLLEDMDIITNAIKVAADLEKELDSMSLDSSLPTSFKPEAATSKQLPQSFSMAPSRNLSISRPSTAVPYKKLTQLTNAHSIRSPVIASGMSDIRPGSTGSDNGVLASDDSSSLTFGDPLCGNPLHALKQRKKIPGSLNFLYSEISDIDSNFMSRPATSLGFRTSKTSEMTLPDSSKKLVLSTSTDCYSSSSSVNSSDMFPSGDKEKSLNASFKKCSSPTNGIRQRNSSSSLNKQSPSVSPFTSPTPPQSPQRPSTSHTPRTGRYRRSHSSKADIISFHSVDETPGAFNSMKLQPQDHTT